MLRNPLRTFLAGSTRMATACAALALFTLALLGWLFTGTSRSITGPWSFVKSVEYDRGTFYRLKVDVAYKGEPVAFDIVVGCNVRITHYKDNDRSVETGIAPFVYGLKMSDGRGLVVRPPQACGGETTENGRVPADLLPFLAVYENADLPTEGIGYASDDAYESPLSQLRFHGATIARATRQEWEAWRRTEALKNIVKLDLMSFHVGAPFEELPWKPGMRLFGDYCRGIIRIALPEEVREAMRKHWPEHRPDYWYPTDDARREFFELAGNIASGTGIPFEGHHFHAYSTNGMATHGMPRRSTGGMIFYRNAPGEIYPVLSDLSWNNLGLDNRLLPELRAKPKLTIADAQVRPELRGFVHCNAGTAPGHANTPRLRDYGDPYAYRVNGQELFETIPDRLKGALASYWYLERNSHVHKDVFGAL